MHLYFGKYLKNSFRLKADDLRMIPEITSESDDGCEIVSFFLKRKSLIKDNSLKQKQQGIVGLEPSRNE